MNTGSELRSPHSGWVGPHAPLLKGIQEHLKARLTWYVAVSIVAGWVIGFFNQGFTKQHQPGLKTLITVAVFFMIYPMMVTVRFDALAQATHNLKGIGLTMFYNFLWAPILGYVLARIFVSDPEVGFGFLLVMVVPGSSMSIGYTGLVRGNLELATVAIASSFVAALTAIPFWLTVLGGSFQMAVPLGLLLNALLTVRILPMVLGAATRVGLIRWRGEEGFKRVAPLFPSITLISMYLIIFLIFFLKAGVLVANWHLVAWLIIPNLVFVITTLILITWLDRRAGLNYQDHMGIVFGATGKNNGTAIALATAAFSPLVAIPAAVLPIFQIIFLVGYVKIEDRIRNYFGDARPPTAEVT